jgi:hypothetical protein
MKRRSLIERRISNRRTQEGSIHISAGAEAARIIATPPRQTPVPVNRRKTEGGQAPRRSQ